jgi:hypothetical protein
VKLRNRGCYGSIESRIVAPRRFWRELFCGKRGIGTKKEKSGKKERNGRDLWKLTPLMEIRPERGFPQRLEKSLAKNARLFHSFPRPDGAIISTFSIFTRGRRPNQTQPEKKKGPDPKHQKGTFLSW